MGGSRWREAARTDVVVGAVVALLAAAVPGFGGAVAAQEPGGYENLQVLPDDIERSELSRIMLANLSGLGLPRRANEGCLFCHVGSMGVEATIDRFRASKDAHPPEVFSPGLIDAVGWYLFRSDRREAAFRLFQLNFDEHPDEYVPTESLAWASRALGDSERALELAEAWVDAHPDHELGLRLLSDMRRREEL